ncbi:hypothetical protein BDY19DRAFT_942402 [Irpex rosettiformis]|uniref:Uncharacterized protein n=1 Tax=Irpex rosettiformis TaxID=378272 RepID=A0ACB8U5D8_9APHY|nr:hypothetical protein BDY19DRAFT_942402 [Irpex rosettiformis]
MSRVRDSDQSTGKLEAHTAKHLSLMTFLLPLPSSLVLNPNQVAAIWVISWLSVQSLVTSIATGPTYLAEMSHLGQELFGSPTRICSYLYYPHILWIILQYLIHQLQARRGPNLRIHPPHRPRLGLHKMAYVIDGYLVTCLIWSVIMSFHIVASCSGPMSAPSHQLA